MLQFLLMLPLALCAILYAGVNESGGEFANPTNQSVGEYSGALINGEKFGGYQFINQSHIQYFINAGVNVFRITLLLERMCPLEYGLGSKFNNTYFDEYQQAVNTVTNGGAYALIDPHNYMRYNNASMQPVSGSVIGNTSDPTAATTQEFAEFWAEMAYRFKYNPNVIFGIMNEPHDMPTQLVFDNDQAAIHAIRGVGASQLILVPGNGYTGAHSWTNSTGSGLLPNSQVLSAIQDPADNYAFDMHQYFDVDFSGTHNACISADTCVSTLQAATSWLRSNNQKAFLSKIGGGSNQNCFDCLNNTLQYLSQNGEWIGWAYWAAGPLWGNYFLSVEPDEGPEFNTTWPMVLKPNVAAASLRSFGISSAYIYGEEPASYFT